MFLARKLEWWWLWWGDPGGALIRLKCVTNVRLVYEGSCWWL